MNYLTVNKYNHFDDMMPHSTQKVINFFVRNDLKDSAHRPAAGFHPESP